MVQKTILGNPSKNIAEDVIRRYWAANPRKRGPRDIVESNVVVPEVPKNQVLGKRKKNTPSEQERVPAVLIEDLVPSLTVAKSGRISKKTNKARSAAALQLLSNN